MHLWRQNSYTMIQGAPRWFLEHLGLHLSVPVEMGTLPGQRFGRVYKHREDWYGSLLLGNRVASGLTDRVVTIAHYYSQQGYHLPVEIHDKREVPSDCYPWHSLTANFRPYQDWVHERILRSDGTGVIDAPPRSGKTLMAARAVDQYAQPTIILAPSLAIVRQTYLALVGIFGSELVARVDGDTPKSQRDISKPIVIATVQSAVKLPREFWDTRGMLIVDEFHHAASDTYHVINDLARNVYYRLCFTGTHWRTGEDGMAMEAICSRVLASVPIPYLVEHKYLAEPYVHFVPFRAPPFPAGDWKEAHHLGIIEHEMRNDLVVSYANQLAEQAPGIVLTSRRAHADYLGERIAESEVVKGGAGALTGKAIDRFKAGAYPVLVGTSVIGEGVDLPNAAWLLYAGGLGGSVQMMQSFFRPLTASVETGKTHGRVYDFRDLHHPTLQRQAESRIRLAEKYLGPWLHAPLAA